MADALLFVTETGSVVAQSVRPAKERQQLAFDPSDGRFAIDVQHDAYAPTPHKTVLELTYYGIVGFLDLAFAKFILVVVDRELAATTVRGSVRVWRIVKVQAVPVWRQALALSLDEEEHERLCLASICNELTTGNLYFSLDVDLTNGPQSGFDRSLNRVGSLSDSRSFFARTNDRFFWNRHLLQPFLSRDTQQFVLPLICGHVGSMMVVLDGPAVSLIFVSRINRHHAGTRYWRRGVNQLGHAAMEAETDVILAHQNGIASFCMIRGSVPLIWSQNNISDPLRRPPIDLSQARSEHSLRAMRRHFEYLMSIYGDSVAVIDMLERRRAKSDIAALSIAYEEALRDWNHPPIKYMKRSAATTKRAIESFMKDIPELVRQQGFFQGTAVSGGVPTTAIRRQLGVIRINSLDCVDEASISQFLIARHALKVMLQELGVWASTRRDFDSTTDYWIRQLWADNADALSRCYTGTPMRYASRIRRTILGAWLAPLRSAVVGLSRLYMSHFQDYARQDSVEFFMGHQDDHSAARVFGPQSRFSSSTLAGRPSVQVSPPPLSPPSPPSPPTSDEPDSPTSGLPQEALPPKLARLQQMAVIENVKQQIRLRRRLSYHELTQPPLLSTILLLRKFTAPIKVTNAYEYALAMTWLFVYVVSIRILKHPASLMIRRPRKELNWDLLPEVKDDPPHGIDVFTRQQHLSREPHVIDDEVHSSPRLTAAPRPSTVRTRKFSGQ
ncbi:hypothetical protein HK105_205756 [Polyrhizophydium stewartii]|uniref:SAC domain-containing protein n=1 Tax=Polyrhizophydium stewartii TaxID=2732419 RepID=A0ABR4N504_9FUNG